MITAKNSFRVGFREDRENDECGPMMSLSSNQSSNSKNGQTNHTLIAKDEHSKRQWLTVLQKTIDTHHTSRFRLAKVAEETDAKSTTLPSQRLGKAMKASSRVALFQVEQNYGPV